MYEYIYVQAMGMAMMLDEIINYVQSLQNQVEVRVVDDMNSLNIYLLYLVFN